MKEGSRSASRPSRREREQARHRRDILAAAEHLFAERGYHETTMQMIADAAEFSVGYLYKHFPSKEDLYRELVAYQVERLDEIVAANQESGLSPLDELRRTYEAICTHFNEHRDFMRIYHQNLGAALAPADAGKRRHRERIERLLTAAIAEGELREVDPRLLAVVMQGASQELFRELAGREVERPFDSLTETVFSLIVDPLRTPRHGERRG